MQTIGFMTLDKNGIERFFKGQKQPQTVGGYEWVVKPDLSDDDFDYGRELPSGTIQTVTGIEPNWHYGKRLFEVRA